MNKFITGILLLFSAFSFATERDANKETQAVVSALLHPNVAPKVAEFSRNADTVTSVKIDELEDMTIYTITGINLYGGDVPCGYGTLIIKQTSALQFGHGNRIPTYQAKVLGESNCH